MPVETVATDVAGDDLVRIYAQASARLEGIVRAGLRAGLNPARWRTPDQRAGDATLAYRARQLVRARAILADLRAQTAAAARAVNVSYLASVVAVDRTIGTGLDVKGGFGTVHHRAVEVLASNMTATLERAVDRAGDNVAAVFRRADELEGALLNGRSPGPLPFIGRRIDDPYRRLALENVAQGLVSLDTRRQVSNALISDLLDSGVTDAITGFVDRSGRRWPLETYAEMVARTTTREATTRATVNRLLEGGAGVVTITSHPHKADVCSPYDGRTFALTAEAAATEDLPRLDVLPPFHPRCRHVVTPGAGNLDAYERELETAAERLAAGQAPTLAELEPRHGPQAPPPFGPQARPSHGPDTAENLADQRALASVVDGDPGPDPGAAAARWGELDLDAKRQVRALNQTLGPDLVKFLKRKTSKEARYRERLLAGELKREELEEVAEETIMREWRASEERAAHAQEAANELRRRSIPCFVCGQFKRRPADICFHCGDDPVSVGGSAEAFNRDHGFAS